MSSPLLLPMASRSYLSDMNLTKAELAEAKLHLPIYGQLYAEASQFFPS